MLLFNILGLRKVDHTNTGFNTSHVTVQRKDDRPNTRRITPFQYIPCYCSTILADETFTEILEFQYIPCYCSTPPAVLTAIRGMCFNTSHVTVQLKKILDSEGLQYKFQYIPCYCSTESGHMDFVNAASFNTSHVTVQPTILSHSYLL